MQLSAIFTTLLSASAVMAAPAKRDVKSMALADPEWTVESMKRVCNEDDSSCTWTFSVNTQLADATPCEYVVEGSPASQTNGGAATCDPYTITTGWDPAGFTVMSIVDVAAGKMIWAGYNDQQLAGGQTVSPDQSYPPSALP